MRGSSDPTDRDDPSSQEEPGREPSRVEDLLRHPAVWAEVPDDLEQRILAELAEPPDAAPS